MSGPVEPVEFLDLDDVLGLASRLLGDLPPVRDVGLLAAAVARPQTIVGERDAYPSLCEKAAALLQSIVGNHALFDGNKRLGWVAAAVFLQINDVDVTRIANDDVYELTMAVAASELDLAAITSRLETLAARRG